MSQVRSGREPLIVLRDVHLHYGATRVLAGVDLDVAHGDKVVVIG